MRPYVAIRTITLIGGLGLPLAAAPFATAHDHTAVGVVVALVAALFEHRQRVLLARLRAARQAQRHGPAAVVVRRSLGTAGTPESLLGRRSGLRAPPAAMPA